jgi:hypothetical protein
MQARDRSRRSLAEEGRAGRRLEAVAVKRWPLTRPLRARSSGNVPGAEAAKMLALYAAPIEDLRQGDLDCCACHHVAPADADVECSYAPADCQRRAMSIGVLIQRSRNGHDGTGRVFRPCQSQKNLQDGKGHFTVEVIVGNPEPGLAILHRG